MRMRKGVIGIVITAAALLSAAVWQRMQTTGQTQLTAPTQHENAPPAASSASVREVQVPDSSTQSHPRMSEHEARMDFHNRVRTFFAQAPAMSADEKAERARTLDAEIERYREAGELSAAEALTLRLGLIRESAPENEQKARMAQLRDEYEYQARTANAPASDPMFEIYKAREREIVTQVQAMEHVPDGLSRDEYLRLMLQREREALLGN